MTAATIEYVLKPTTFQTIQQAQNLSKTLEENLLKGKVSKPSIRSRLIEIFSELAQNAAEHGQNPAGARAQVSYLPYKGAKAFHVAVKDLGPGIYATLARKQDMLDSEDQKFAIAMAVLYMTSGTQSPDRGAGLWKVRNEMDRPRRLLWIRSGTGLLFQVGAKSLALRPANYRQGTTFRLIIPG